MKNLESMEEILLKEGKVSQKQIEEAVSLPARGGSRGKQLVELGFVSEDDFLGIASKRMGLPFIKIPDVPEESIPNLGEKLQAKYLKEFKIFPLNLQDNALTIAAADPFDAFVADDLSLTLGYEIKVCLAREAEITEAIEKFYGTGASAMQQIVGDMAEGEIEVMGKEEEENLDSLKDMASEAPVIKLVNLIVSRAIKEGASDVHIEPFEGSLVVRYRVDGILHNEESPPKQFQAAVISRIKIMAKLNIAERRLPQDGRIRLKILGKDIDLRVSTLPTLYGESVVMRILDRGTIVFSLEKIGFPPKELAGFSKIITMPYGMFLVTGPTGSGKTTTLYAALTKINSPDKKIITIEDPVEYQLHGVNQIHVKSSIGLTFANGLRSIVRQDPDVIMVGEIRDSETADVAIQAALTGHMVFSTVHTNDSAGAVTRLLDMGIENYLISSSLLGVLAQRLVRIICRNCREPYRPDEKLLKEIMAGGSEGVDVIYKSVGCPECNNTGYKGRVGIFEFLVVNDEIRKLILEKSSANIIKEAARRGGGMSTLREDGWKKVRAGTTTVSEIYRVTLEEDVY
ncbi:MAG: type II secretion system ATPase GspE [Nitrospinae bacterium]|nr:type II secretion system ATPase GspE [Nitrospinota bacterium]